MEVNVGYETADGRRAALNAADEVVREFSFDAQFSFDALTIRVSPEAAPSLAERADVRYVEENGTMRALCTVGAATTG